MRLVKPKKFLGQHFLKDQRVAQDIADTVDACPDLPILEVGPGMGVLTQFLLKKERPVKVVEVDYGTFMDMISEKNIGLVQVEDTEIIFTDKENTVVYTTGAMNDPDLTKRLYDSGAQFTRVVEEPMSPLLSLFLTTILPILIFIGLVQYMRKKLL